MVCRVDSAETLRMLENSVYMTTGFQLSRWNNRMTKLHAVPEYSPYVVRLSIGGKRCVLSPVLSGESDTSGGTDEKTQELDFKPEIGFLDILSISCDQDIKNVILKSWLNVTGHNINVEFDPSHRCALIFLNITTSFKVSIFVNN